MNVIEEASVKDNLAVGTRYVHMLKTPEVVCQTPEQYQSDKNDSCFRGENRIILVQPSQIQFFSSFSQVTIETI